MLAEALKALLTEEQQRCLAAAMASGALFAVHEGRYYAYREELGRTKALAGWWVWELRSGSQEYFVRQDGTCTCPCEQVPCKHARMVKFGSSSTAWNAPKQRKRRKLARGER